MTTIYAAVKPRWVRRDISHYALKTGCPCCGTMAGNTPMHSPCPVVSCMLCGSHQCHGNGLGNGRCAVCLYGFLPGWSRPVGSHTCGYAKCNKPAVALIPGKKIACADHAMAKIGAKVHEALAHRDSGKGWQHWIFTGPRVPWPPKEER